VTKVQYSYVHVDYHIEDDCEELVSKFEERLKIDDRPGNLNSLFT
jgi:hypothetical protein